MHQQPKLQCYLIMFPKHHLNFLLKRSRNTFTQSTNKQDKKVLFVFSYKQTFCTLELLVLQLVLHALQKTNKKKTIEKKKKFSSSLSQTGSSRYLPSTKADSSQQLTSSEPSRGRKHNNELVVNHYFQHMSIKHPLLSPSSDLGAGTTSGGKKTEKSKLIFFHVQSISADQFLLENPGVPRRSSAEGTLSSRFKLTPDFTRLDWCTCLCAPNARICTEAKTIRQR